MNRELSGSLSPAVVARESFLADAAAASDHAYQVVAQQEHVSPDEVYKMPLCRQVASLMVKSLSDCGHRVDQEVRVIGRVFDHSYVTASPGRGVEQIIDPTWQQFLPADRRTAELPKVLVGSRAKVVARARSYGVDEFALGLWTKPLVKDVVRRPGSPGRA
jgi:hypothetical protein